MYFRAGCRELTEEMNWLGSYLLDEAAQTQSWNIRFWSVVLGETEFIFDVANEKVCVARSPFGSHCNTVDLVVVVVAK